MQSNIFHTDRANDKVFISFFFHIAVVLLQKAKCRRPFYQPVNSKEYFSCAYGTVILC